MIISPLEKTEKAPLMNNALTLDKIGKKYAFIKTQDKGINDEFKDFWALSDVSLSIPQGQIMGIIGRNGAGKTTLLNIIAGVLSPTQGKVSVCGKILGLFNLGVGFQDELTGKENIFLNGAILGASRKELGLKLHSIIEFSELGDFIDMPLGSYSQGMRLRLGFSIIANLDFDILAIDEVLAVGDISFQNKCFERLMDFKRRGKTLLLSSQNIDLIERLCAQVAVLEHGRLIFYGEKEEAIYKYRILLNAEKFFVGPPLKNTDLIEDTKKWAEDIQYWRQKVGTKEAAIKSVDFIDRYGKKCKKIKPEEPLTIKVTFNAKNSIKDVHFGIAIFRTDGVYCYGPNTAFDGYEILEIKEGERFFLLKYKKLLLAPGEYRCSVAIWDKNETLAYDFHCGCYPLVIEGNNKTSELTRISFKTNHSFPLLKNILGIGNKEIPINPNSLIEFKGQKTEPKGIRIGTVSLLNNKKKPASIFFTNETIQCTVVFNELKTCKRNLYLWLGLFRDDNVYCQGITLPIKNRKTFKIVFPKFPLLPGGYKFSLGIWDSEKNEFQTAYPDIISFRMVFSKEDHGTIYIDHHWSWEEITP